MRKALLALAFTAAAFPNTSPAALMDEYSFQAKTRHLSATTPFWSRLLSTLQGKEVSPADVSVTVLDAEGQPLAGATVLVGSKQGLPFSGNQITTDANGVAQFSDAALKEGVLPSVTATKDGYSSLTLSQPAGNQIELRLPRQAAENEFAFLEGRVDGFPTGYPTSTLELGMFLPAFRTESLMNFDPQQFVSSYTTKISLIGERDVPGNVLLPTQRKRYGFIPITLSKPDYIMPLATGMKAHMSALAGAVSISDAVGAIQNNDFLGAINLASFTHVTWTNGPVEVRGNERFNLTFNQEISPRAVQAKLSGVPAGLDVVSVSVVDPSGERNDFIPLDVKAVKSESLQNGATNVGLGTLKNRREGDGFYVFSGVFNRNDLTNANSSARWIVGSLQPVNTTSMDARFNGFLRPLASNGVFEGQREYRFTSPANTEAGLVPDVILVNIVSEKKNPETKGIYRRVLWSAVLPGNADRVSLPDLGRPVLPAPDLGREETFRWEVIAVKASSNAGSDIQSVLRNLQHVSSLSQKY